MLNKILYTVLGIGIALVFLPRISRVKLQPPVVAGAVTEQVAATIASAAPEMALNLQPPLFSAKAALAYDLNSGTILYSKNSDEKLPIASLTKLMTALIVYKNGKLDGEVTVGKKEQGVLGTNMGILAGEKISVESLLKGMLIPSSNDAALALGNFIAGSSDKFAQIMNQEADSLGMISTHYDNPVGYDSDENFSNTLDLIKLAREYLKYPYLAAISKTKETTVKSVDGNFSHHLLTSNQLLLDDPNVEGLKTGFTSRALGNLIILYNHDGHRIISIVLGSENREQDSRNLLDWLFKVYKW